MCVVFLIFLRKALFSGCDYVLQDADGLALAIDSMKDLLKGIDFDVVVGTESRGFIRVPIAMQCTNLCTLKERYHLDDIQRV